MVRGERKKEKKNQAENASRLRKIASGTVYPAPAAAPFFLFFASLLLAKSVSLLQFEEEEFFFFFFPPSI